MNMNFCKAFRKKHSCDTQMIIVISDRAKILENGVQGDTFILGFEKALDTLSYELHKRKLYGYGNGSKTLIYTVSFLCDRQQRAVINTVKSERAPVLPAVRHATNLGPLLFSLYINVITEDIDSELKLFADERV